MTHHHTFVLLFIIIIAIFPITAEAKSVYAITDHDTDTIGAYQIRGSQLWSPYTQSAIQGSAIDVTIDSLLNLLFVTYEASGGISCLDANTLAEKAHLDTNEMAGIAADEAKRLVYCVERQTSYLHIYRWDGDNIVVVNTVKLTGLGSTGAFGVALDKAARRLYVTNDTNTVNYYNVDDPCWAWLGSRDVGVPAMDIDVDPNRGYLYIGGYQDEDGGSGNSTYLVRHNLRTNINPNTQQDIGDDVIGVAVDPVSGLVYLTTIDKKVRVYDCSGSTFVNTYSVATGGYSYPAGICVESATINWSGFTKSDDVNEGECVSPGRKITYTITYDVNGINDSNLVITDYLPAGVDYSSSPTGAYNVSNGTVCWNFQALHLPISGSVSLSVNVNDSALPGCDITNIAEIKSDSFLGYAECTVSACWWSGNIIYVDGNATGGLNDGTSWDNAYRDFDDALVRAPDYVNGLGSCEIWVAGGTYEPAYEGEDYIDATFQIPAGNIHIRGHFGGKGVYETSPDQRDFNNPAYETFLNGQVGPDNSDEADYLVTCDNNRKRSAFGWINNHRGKQQGVIHQ